MHAIRLSRTGGPDVLEYTEVEKPKPRAGELLVRVAAAGVNFIDIYYRTGLYKATLPLTLGFEGAGTVVATGAGVSEIEIGDRVAWALWWGSYAEYISVPQEKVVRIPDGIDEPTAAAAMVQGTTAHYLTRDTYSVKAGDIVLVHAAAGGTGLLITQMAKRRGARVIATVSTERKAHLARSVGADDVILYNDVDFEQEVRRLTNGAGVACVYDSVGQATFEKSLKCLQPLGTMVVCGTSSGPIPPFEIQRLSELGSLFLTRPNGFTYTAKRDDFVRHANAVLTAITQDELQIHFERPYTLREAAIAQADLEGRKTMGKLILRP